MEKIASFKVNHLNLKCGVYLSRQDVKSGVTVSTYDLRFTMPNVEPVMDMPAIHTIEHLGATYLRNSQSKEDIVYFGPMGCRTGFYLITFGEKSAKDIYPLVEKTCKFILEFKGEIPGADAKSCGNYSEQNLEMAKYYVNRFLERMQKESNFTYGE